MARQVDELREIQTTYIHRSQLTRFRYLPEPERIFECIILMVVGLGDHAHVIGDTKQPNASLSNLFLVFIWLNSAMYVIVSDR